MRPGAAVPAELSTAVEGWPDTATTQQREDRVSKSIAISPFTMPAALAAADKFINNATWYSDFDNTEQTTWLSSFRRRATLAAGIPEIHNHATSDIADHMEWLCAEGWDAQITQSGSDARNHDVFLAATLNIVAKWCEVGHAYHGFRGVDRVLLKAGAHVGRVHASGVHPVVEVTTQHPGFAFTFQQVNASPTDRMALLNHALHMAISTKYEDVHLDFPMVDLHVRDDARYMIGLHSGPNVVTQAAEQLRLELNEIGGRASAAAEVAVTRSLGPRTIKIDGPFIVAVHRVGAPADDDLVVFAAYCDRDSWKRPADGRI